MAVTREHGATVANTALTVTLTSGNRRVRVTNRGGADLFVGIPNVTAASITAPTVNGADLYVVPVNQSLELPVTGGDWNQVQGGTKPTATSVKMISSAIAQYSVEGLGF